MRDSYTWFLEMSKQSGEFLGRFPVTPDWEPAVESARWAGLRQHDTWVSVDDSTPRITPEWHAGLGEPYAERIQVELTSQNRTWYATVTATSYFAELARQVLAQLVSSGTVNADEPAHYCAIALANTRPVSSSANRSFQAASASSALPLTLASTETFRSRSTARGEATADEFDAYVPQATLDEIVDLTRQAGARETGGILIGYLHRDRDTRDVFAEVTAQIPARHTESASVKLTFTSLTWTDVRSAMTLRSRGELMLGWWHSHPAFDWCKDCAPERQRVCSLARGFLSADDCALHRAIFPQAFALAFLATHSIAGIRIAAFGWSGGTLSPRAYRVLGADRHANDESAQSTAETAMACREPAASVAGASDAAPTQP